MRPALRLQSLFGLCLALAALLSLGPGCSSQTIRPNIVLAIADDWSWPHAGAYGDGAIQTPTFDRLAREGVLFEHAYVSSPSCTPSRGAIITGQQFWRLETGGDLWSTWPAKFAEYPQLLAGAGYHVGSYRKAWGPGEHPLTLDNPGGKEYQSVDSFFGARPAGSPFCFWFGTNDPHRPYEEGSGARNGVDPARVHLFPHYPDAPEVRADVADYYSAVQRFDREMGELLERIEAMGELDNTLIVMTSDNGMPFPRSKSNIYDSGVRMPLAIRWPAQVPGGRVVTDFVSLTDIAPTFLAAAGLGVPREMTGRSLLRVLRSGGSGRVESWRDHVLFGKERHVPSQETGDYGGYPMRAIRTDDYLYIENLRPDKWPAGTPDHERAHIPGIWLGDCDNSPTKTFLWQHRDDPEWKRYYDLAFAKRPAEELYDLQKDPGQLTNVAGDPAYADVQRELAARLTAARTELADPRITGGGEYFDQQEYLGHGPRWPPEE